MNSEATWMDVEKLRGALAELLKLREAVAAHKSICQSYEEARAKSAKEADALNARCVLQGQEIGYLRKRVVKMDTANGQCELEAWRLSRGIQPPKPPEAVGEVWKFEELLSGAFVWRCPHYQCDIYGALVIRPHFRNFKAECPNCACISKVPDNAPLRSVKL